MEKIRVGGQTKREWPRDERDPVGVHQHDETNLKISASLRSESPSGDHRLDMESKLQSRVTVGPILDSSTNVVACVEGWVPWEPAS